MRFLLGAQNTTEEAWQSYPYYEDVSTLTAAAYEFVLALVQFCRRANSLVITDVLSQYQIRLKGRFS